MNPIGEEQPGRQTEPRAHPNIPDPRRAMRHVEKGTALEHDGYRLDGEEQKRAEIVRANGHGPRYSGMILRSV
jgi:hypothetical protein